MGTRHKSTDVPSHEAVAAAMETLLESPFWPITLAPDAVYSRVHDDSDGRRGDEHQLAVLFDRSSDAWVLLPGMTSLRFRDPLGGGVSPRVRNALLVLAEAIRRDNDADVGHRGV
jgi:hypothetical protein